MSPLDRGDRLGRRLVNKLTTAGGRHEQIEVAAVGADRLAPALPGGAPGLTAVVASDVEVGDLVGAGVGGLDERFTAAAGERGDRCVIIRFGDDTVGFYWFATGSAPLRPGVEVRCRDGSAVAYRTYTVRQFRAVPGIRAAAVSLAALTAMRSGATRLVMFASPVDRARLDAYRAVGFRRTASLHVLSLGRHSRTWLRGADDDPPCSFRIRHPS